MTDYDEDLARCEMRTEEANEMIEMDELKERVSELEAFVCSVAEVATYRESQVVLLMTLDGLTKYAKELLK